MNAIQDALDHINTHEATSAKWAAIENLLYALDERGETRGPWFVYLTDFHGGRRISRHNTVLAAAKRAYKERVSGCTCGCAYVTNDPWGGMQGCGR
jgi:hypothetical protein